MPGVYPRAEHQKSASFGYVPALLANTRAARNEHSSLLWTFVNYERKSFITLTPGGRCYKTFYGRKVWIFEISQSDCQWQAFPACLKGRAYPSEALALLANTWPARNEHSSLLWTLVNYGRKKFHNIRHLIPRCRIRLKIDKILFCQGEDHVFLLILKEHRGRHWKGK